MACDTMDKVCYSSNDNNDYCDELRLERVPAGNHCCKNRGIYVTTSWFFHWPTTVVTTADQNVTRCLQDGRDE